MDVRALSFTGSTRTGRLIQEASSKSNLKAISLELGGKSPAIVFGDADLEAAVTSTAHGIQSNSGQVCMANSRIYVQDTIADRFIDLFKAKFSEIAKMGDPTSSETKHGPLVDKAQFDKVLEYIEIGKRDGHMVLGPDSVSADKGYFIQPTIFTSTSEGSQIMKEEVFGPVVNINVFHNEKEVLAKANDTEYGLYASVFTNDISRAMRIAKGFQAGTVGINCSSPVTGPDTPFGGYKGSGVGREGVPYHSLDFFLETKSVIIKVAG
jgi:acyl-CoA reductase-like NAD-dependent aldehyde dehydrogenase